MNLPYCHISLVDCPISDVIHIKQKLNKRYANQEGTA